MLQIEIYTTLSNMLMRPDPLRNRWVNSSDFKFVVADLAPRPGVDKGGPWSYRQSINISPNAITNKKLRPRRLRAEIMHGACKLARQRGVLALSWRQIDEVYLWTLATDGCDPTWVAMRRAELYADGFLTKLWGYWRIPSWKRSGPIEPPAPSPEPSSSSPSGDTPTPPSQP